MIRAALILLLTTTAIAFERITKCSQVPITACGLNSNCHDNPSDYLFYRHKGPYCKCTSDSIGKPPNCKKSCGNDSNCQSGEYCDAKVTGDCLEGCRKEGICAIGHHCDSVSRKCVDGCEDSANCLDDEFCDLKGQKCQKICSEDTCGPNGKCLAKNHTKYCSCVDGFISVSGIGCEPANIESSSPNCGTSCTLNSNCEIKDYKTFCYCQEKPEINAIVQFCPPQPLPGPVGPLKPTDEDSISLQVAFILAGR